MGTLKYTVKLAGLHAELAALKSARKQFISHKDNRRAIERWIGKKEAQIKRLVFSNIPF